jgi:hypothetical protein
MDYQMTMARDDELEQVLMFCNSSMFVHMTKEAVICYLSGFATQTPLGPTASSSSGMSFLVPIPRTIFTALGFGWFLDEE